MNYYNENDPKAAAWLRELIRGGHIPNGDVDERSIIDVKPHELTSYVQQHFFAGIGGWSFALKLAGWPEDRPVRTGSCPCQPFSQTGKRLGTKDERHLWPHFRDLITFGESTVTFGEQVSSPLGREWLAGVRADLEGLGYEVGGADLCAASVGAPHIRQRLYWVANATDNRRAPDERKSRRRQIKGPHHASISSPDIGRLADAKHGHGRRQQQSGEQTDNAHEPGSQGRNERIRECDRQWPIGTPNLVVCCEDGKARRFEPGSQCLVDGLPETVVDCWNESIIEIQKEIIRYAASTFTRPDQILRALQSAVREKFIQWCAGGQTAFLETAVLFAALCEQSGQLGTIFNGQTSRSSEALQTDVRDMREGWETSSPSQGRELSKQRAGQLANLVRELSQKVAPIVQIMAPTVIHGYPLAHGVRGRVGLLRGFGNGIVPQVAAEFIQAACESIGLSLPAAEDRK